MSEGIRPAGRVTPAEPVRVQPTREQSNQSRREQAKRLPSRRPPTPVPEAGGTASHSRRWRARP
jgi:hypothetical protein